MTPATARRLTLEEYLIYDDGTDTRYELVDGALIELPPESRQNHKIASFLFEVFIRLGLSSSLLTIGIQIAVNSRKATARQPDFVLLSQECADALEGAGSDIITAAMPVPALVVEVVSPGEPGEDNYDRDYIDKRKEYAERGISEFWLIDPSRSVVIVLSLANGSYKAAEFRGSDRVVSPTFPESGLVTDQVLKAGQ